MPCSESQTFIRTNLDGSQTYINEGGNEFPLVLQETETTITGTVGEQVFTNEAGDTFPILIPADMADQVTTIDGGAGEQVYTNETGATFPILIPDICTQLDALEPMGLASI